ncbi:MAG TPA: primosomal protein N' [Pirellulales bacterium]|nr:primosomal protein N' [Pirellulales bacterium]
MHEKAGHPGEQQQLFDTEAPPWELDDAERRWVATLVIPGGPRQEFDYLVPDALRPRLAVGQRVRVTLGRGDRPMVGYCVRLEHRAVGGRRLKPVNELVDERALLSPAMLRLTQWMAEHYLCPLAQVLDAVVPAAVRGKAGTRLTTLLSVPTKVAARLATLDLPKKQAAILQYLAASSEPLTPAQLAQRIGCAASTITGLRRKGLIVAENRRIHHHAATHALVAREENLALNADQQLALDSILASLRSQQHQTLLLHGVTGSGKTEVYIRAIQEVVGYGRQAIVLVPEISLTPQAQERFRARFGRVAVLHSHLTDSERHAHWQEIAAGQVSVVVGARSAIFAPTPHLGLIVLDEEHEGSFKQDTAPRYHARDVALRRAAAEQVPLVLGSATPSLESWHRGQTGEYRLIEMPRRVFDRPLPAVVTIDLRNETRDHVWTGSISRPLHAAMREALESGGQVILLLNRRGFATHIQCAGCGHVVRCPNCDIALTHHRQSEIALCHYCDYELAAPTRCPECQFIGIRYSGLGTQRLEAEVRARFPDYAALRMDTDTMQGPGSHERALAAFRNGEVRILLGTQMIAKGLDFPDVTLVGVVNADTALHLPDFRAAERTFQLLVQVAGRTGRGPKGGRVLVQTFSPDHAAIRAAVRHDYQTFAAEELPNRQALSYPPFASMSRLVVRGPKEPAAREFAGHLAERLTAALARHAEHTARVLGPAPAPIAKLRGLHRFQIQLQAPLPEPLHAALREAIEGVESPEGVQWIVDVDPLDMM